MKKDVKRKINLEDLERRGISKIAFIVHNDECIVNPIKREMENRLYAKKEYGISLDEYDKSIHGYMTKDQIILYKSSFDILEKGKMLSNDYDGDYENILFPGEWTYENKIIILKVINKYKEIYNKDNWVVYLLDKGILKPLYSSAEYNMVK